MTVLALAILCAIGAIALFIHTAFFWLQLRDKNIEEHIRQRRGFPKQNVL
jgi:hypothetical protein